MWRSIGEFMRIAFLFLLVFICAGCATCSVHEETEKPKAVPLAIEEPPKHLYLLPRVEERLVEYNVHPQSAEPTKSASMMITPEATTKLNIFSLPVERNTVEVSVGSIEDDIPSTMKVGKTEEISVTIDNRPDIPLTKNATKILVAQCMKVTLTGDGFEITPRSTEEQEINCKLGPTTWRWSVTPIKSGSLKLRVNATMIIGKSRKDVPTFVKTVAVESNKVKSSEYFLSKHKNELISILGSGGFIALMGWFYSLVRKQERFKIGSK
jgi:hypothetical protein